MCLSMALLKMCIVPITRKYYSDALAIVPVMNKKDFWLIVNWLLPRLLTRCCRRSKKGTTKESEAVLFAVGHCKRLCELHAIEKKEEI